MTRLLQTTVLLLVSLVVAPSLVAQDFYGFSRILRGKTRSINNTFITPTKFTAGTAGGVIQVRMPDTAGTCFGEYEFAWNFLDDIKQLQKGKEYRLQMTGRRVAGKCEKNTNVGMIRSSNSGGVLVQKEGLQSPANIIQVQKSGRAVGFPVGAANKVDLTFKVLSTSRDETYFTLVFDFSSFPYSSTSKACSFEVAYVYKKNQAAAVGGLNCPALYGLGVNIGILEYASLDDAKTSFLAGFIDNAVKGAKASACVPKSEIEYLLDLKQRMLKQETSRAFAVEISSFRQKLARIVADKCNCK